MNILQSAEKFSIEKKLTGRQVFLLIFLSFIFAALTAAYIFINAFISSIRPPEIPANPLISVAPNPYADLSDPAFILPEGHEADLLIGGGMFAPKGFTSEYRKDLFYTFLILGLDEGVNVDTIMVASYDGLNKEANIISIPRDSLVNVSRNIRKINAAYPAGTLRGGGRTGGIAQMQREVMTVIGFVPDFYILVDLDAFIKIIDAVGYIEIDVPFHMRYDDPYQGLHIDIPAGRQLLNGENALNFARYRRGNRGFPTITDYRRIEHQQMVIRAILNNLLQPANILRIPELITIFNENVHSNLSTGNIIWLANQLNEIGGTEALSTYTLPTSGSLRLTHWYEILDGPAIVELVNRTINPYTKDITLADLDIISY